MKKIIAVLLSLALLLGCAAGTAEDAGEKIIFGTLRANGEFTLKGYLPEGYKVVPFEISDEAMLSRILSDDPTKPEIMLSIAMDEAYADVEKLNDLDDEELLILERTFTDTDPYAVITYDETAHGTRLMVCRTMSDISDYLTVLSIYQGYMIEMAMTPGRAAEQRLTDEQVEAANSFLSELDFVSGIEAQELKTAGETLDALITGFDAENRTINVTLLEPFTLTEWEVVSINEGDTIRIGTEDIVIESLEYETENCDAYINGEYSLMQREDGLFTATDFDYPIMKEAKELTLAVPENLVFTEGIEPEFGEPLAEAVNLTAEEFFAALEAAEKGGVGFHSQNVRLTFGEDSGLVQVERYYAPWQ